MFNKNQIYYRQSTQQQPESTTTFDEYLKSLICPPPPPADFIQGHEDFTSTLLQPPSPFASYRSDSSTVTCDGNISANPPLEEDNLNT